MLFVVKEDNLAMFSLSLTYMFSPGLTVAICSRCPVCSTRNGIKLWERPLTRNDVDRNYKISKASFSEKNL